MMSPLGVLRDATKEKRRGGMPFPNNRFPAPSTTGKTNMRNSSTRSAAISVCSNSLLPQIWSSGPSDAFNLRRIVEYELLTGYEMNLLAGPFFPSILDEQRLIA